jgi:hypothetical protein
MACEDCAMMDNRLAETSAALAELDRPADATRTDGNRGGRRGASRLIDTGGVLLDADPEPIATDAEQAAQAR